MVCELETSRVFMCSKLLSCLHFLVQVKEDISTQLGISTTLHCSLHLYSVFLPTKFIAPMDMARHHHQNIITLLLYYVLHRKHKSGGGSCHICYIHKKISPKAIDLSGTSHSHLEFSLAWNYSLYELSLILHMWGAPALTQTRKELLHPLLQAHVAARINHL